MVKPSGTEVELFFFCGVPVGFFCGVAVGVNSPEDVPVLPGVTGKGGAGVTNCRLSGVPRG